MTNRPQPHFNLVAALAGACAFALTLATPSTASAQEWLKDRRYQEGAGIRAGDLELHPGLGGEVGYDSNYFLRTYKEDPRFVNGGPTNPPTDAGELRITPSFTLSTISNQRLEGQQAPSPIKFSAGAAATYREFIGSQEIRDQRNVSGNAFARLDVFPGRPLGFGVFATYQRDIQPAVVSNVDLSFNRSDVGAGAEIIALPGGGTLDLRAGYQFSGALYEQRNGLPYTNLTHEISIRNRWRFRPRTALFHDTTLRFISYPNASSAVNYLNGSTPLRTRVGITGLLTERFGVLLAAGYGATFFDNPNQAASTQYDSINAQAEGTFYLSQNNGSGEPGQSSLLLSTINFGFVRDFQNSLLSNFYTSDKGYVKLEYFFSGKALITLSGYFEALSYPQPFYNTVAGPQKVAGADGNPTGSFTNYHVGGVLFSEYRFTEAFGLNATFDYSQTISNVALQGSAVLPNTAPIAANGAGSLFDLSWRRVQAFIGARYFF